jgi:hypothetical protein
MLFKIEYQPIRAHPCVGAPHHSHFWHPCTGIAAFLLLLSTTTELVVLNLIPQVIEEMFGGQH